MKQKFNPLFLITLLLLIFGQFSAAHAEGHDPILTEYLRFYHAVDIPWDAKSPDVVEFFSYNCNYCFAAEHAVKIFKTIKPASLSFQPYQIARADISWQLSQYTFAAAYLAGVEEQVHDGLFHRFNVDKRPFETKDDVVAFFRSKGLLGRVSPYLESKESRDLRMHIYQMGVDYKISRVPTFIVRGRYMVAWGSDQDPTKLARLLVALAALQPPTAADAGAAAP